MTFPDILGQGVDEADFFPDGTLVEWIRRQIAIKVPGTQVGDHFGRRNDTDLDVLIRVQTMFGDVITQQEVVHRIFERHTELEALPLFGIAFIKMVVMQDNRLPVDVFNCRHQERGRGRTGPHGDGKRHGGEHMRRVIFIVQGLVARNRPARRLDHIDIKTVFLIKAHRLGHNDRCGAGDRNKADIKLGLFRRAQIIKDRRLDLIKRQDRRQCRHHRAAANHFGKGTTRNLVMPEDRADHRTFNRAIQHFLAAGKLARR